MADLIGVFGGTFDPPHVGHLILAEQARAEFRLKKILWVVSGIPPHKPDRNISPLDQRLAMVELAIEGNPDFEICRADIDRDPPYYAHGTLAWLKKRNPDRKYAYLMGGDSLRDLPSWDQPESLIAQCERIIVMQRPNADFDIETVLEQFPALRQRLVLLDVPQIEISGQVIRQRARSGGAYRYFVPEPIYAYIEKHQLYR
jgi:nicotinate-nucleotide adenylyltransferase